jgi:hypothetical protein
MRAKRLPRSAVVLGGGSVTDACSPSTGSGCGGGGGGGGDPGGTTLS